MFVLLGEPWRSILLYAGPTVVTLALGVYGFFVGWWRTKFELEGWVDRALCAEKELAAILPVLITLNAAMVKLTVLVEESLRRESSSEGG